MSSLDVSANQKSILDALTPDYQSAWGAGVTSSSSVILQPIPHWSTIPGALQQSAIDAERVSFACFLVAMGFDRVGMGTAGSPHVVSYMKPDTTTGTMTFVGGLLVAST